MTMKTTEGFMATKISDEVLAEVWKDFKADLTDQRLRNILIERYFPLVKYNAERVWQKLPEGVDLNDLISAGTFGLMDAIEAFDMERGVKFETYCVPRIRGAMLDELRTMDWVPRLVRSKASKLEAGLWVCFSIRKNLTIPFFKHHIRKIQKPWRSRIRS